MRLNLLVFYLSKRARLRILKVALYVREKCFVFTNLKQERPVRKTIYPRSMDATVKWSVYTPTLHRKRG